MVHSLHGAHKQFSSGKISFFLFFSKISFLVWHCGFVSVRSLVGNIALCSVSSQRKLEHNATD